MRASLTDVFVRGTKPREHGSFNVFDTTMRGLCLRVSAAGTKSFCLIQGKQRTRTYIGKYPHITLADARSECRRILAESALGIIRPPPSMRVDVAVAAFLKDCEQRNKARTVADYKYLLERHLERRFADRSLDGIKTREVLNVTDGLRATPAEQNHAHTIMAIFFRWCFRRGHIERSPMERLQLPARLKPRTRVLDEDEIKAIWNVAGGQGGLGNLVRLCILLGQRRSEIGNLRWDWINKKTRTITFPPEVVKNNRTHTIPYGPLVLEVIESNPSLGDFVFSGRDPAKPFQGWHKGKVLLDKALIDAGHTIAPWTLHDLRRSAATMWASMGAPPHIVERILNHATGQISGVAAIYNRFNYIDEMRAILEAWENRLVQITTERPQQGELLHFGEHAVG